MFCSHRPVPVAHPVQEPDVHRFIETTLQALAKGVPFYSHAGELCRAISTFCPTLRDQLGPWHECAHMRLGRFGVLLVRNIYTWETDLVVGQEYTDDLSLHPDMRTDRLSQLERIEQALRPEHPLQWELMVALAAEREAYNRFQTRSQPCTAP